MLPTGEIHEEESRTENPGLFGLAPGWWPVAFGQEVRRHPISAVLGTQALALYRDLSGTVRAVADVCPHRRMPLSLGRITADGYLQCAYHGWCFDGATGQCMRIPNLRADERPKANVRVAAFATVEGVVGRFGWQLRTGSLAPAVGPPTGEEPADDGTRLFETQLSDGFVVVWTGVTPPSSLARSGLLEETAAWTFHSESLVRAPYGAVMDALLWNPGRLLGLTSLLGAGDELIAPHATVVGDRITVTRERLTFDIPRPHTFKPVNRASRYIEITMNMHTGLTSILVEPTGARAAVQVAVALTPTSRYQTIVRWRATTVRTPDALVRRMASVRFIPGAASAAAHRAIDSAARQHDDPTRRLREFRVASVDLMVDRW